MGYFWDTWMRRHMNDSSAAGLIAKPSDEHVANIRAWYRVWRSLSNVQQEAWQKLSRAEKDATYQMSAEEFRTYMNELVKKAA